ncbi:hypothetical protein AMECASPLE_022277 [Ameca splendens]|uniref:Uncharacterized protein n=1 Tax=Ameca splendens TaxID=208324 RepID=A0ABV0ZPZ1_9TELE
MSFLFCEANAHSHGLVMRESEVGLATLSESGCLRACCFLFPPLGSAELEDRRSDRCSSLTHQFRGLYEGGSPAFLCLSVFALRGSTPWPYTLHLVIMRIFTNSLFTLS